MTALNPAAMAWQRFSRGLPEEVRSVEMALLHGFGVSSSGEPVWIPRIIWRQESTSTSTVVPQARVR